MNEKNKKLLLNYARKSIKSVFNGESFVPDKIPSDLKSIGCCFVTLNLDGELRGCIGNLEPFEPLYKNVINNAVNAAFKDSRFKPLSRSEFNKIKIEISVISSAVPLIYDDYNDLLNKLRIGQGVIFKKGFYQSTFLPQVWEMIPDKIEFLKNLSLKAGLHGDAWRDDPDIFVYGVEKFSE